MQVDLPSILTVIPPKLQPIILRSGAKFQDLKDHIFEKDEVQWVCEEIDKKHAHWEYQRVSIQAISKRYNIHKDGLRRWMNSYKANEPLDNMNKCDANSECPFYKKSFRRIVAWQYSELKCPLELEIIISDELENTFHRKRNKILGKR